MSDTEKMLSAPEVGGTRIKGYGLDPSMSADELRDSFDRFMEISSLGKVLS